MLSVIARSIWVASVLWCSASRAKSSFFFGLVARSRIISHSAACLRNFSKCCCMSFTAFSHTNACTYFRGCKLGELTQSLTWDAASASRTLRSKSSFSLPGGSREAFSLISRMKDAMRSWRGSVCLDCERCIALLRCSRGRERKEAFSSPMSARGPRGDNPNMRAWSHSN